MPNTLSQVYHVDFNEWSIQGVDTLITLGLSVFNEAALDPKLMLLLREYLGVIASCPTVEDAQSTIHAAKRISLLADQARRQTGRMKDA